MNPKPELKKFSETVAVIRSIAGVYEQAAAKKMKEVKVEIEKIKKYLQEAQNTYSSSKLSLVEKQHEADRMAILSASFRKAIKKRVLVLVTSNSYYYGNLIPGIFKLFWQDFLANGSDSIILGDTGKELYQKEILKGNKSYPNITFSPFNESKMEWEIIHSVNEQIAKYEEIVVYYGQFRTILTQVPAKANLSQAIQVKSQGEIKKYLFRPRGDFALSFLENQMVGGGFLQKVYEGQVAKYAARIKILEIGQVAEKISETLTTLGVSKRKVRKNIFNKKQQQLYSGSTLWEL